MIRGTTPLLGFRLPVHTENIDEVLITFAQRNKELFTVDNAACDFDEDMVNVLLSQEQTLALGSNAYVDVQFRIVDTRGHRLASDILHIPVGRLLKDGEI